MAFKSLRQYLKEKIVNQNNFECNRDERVPVNILNDLQLTETCLRSVKIQKKFKNFPKNFFLVLTAITCLLNLKHKFTCCFLGCLLHV